MITSSSSVLIIALALAVGLAPMSAKVAQAGEPEARPDPNLEVASDDAEPVKCFKVAWQHESNGGLRLSLGVSLDLCGGTRSSHETLKCFRKAYAHPANDGLGLSLGNAVQLCRTNPARE
jgi:hypothetical protein